MRRTQRGDASVWLLLALAVSLLGNWWLWNGKSAEHDARTTAETNLQTANNQTDTCNKSIKDLETAAYERGRRAEVARAAAKARRAALDRLAQTELSTPATVPGNDCQSAKDRVERILKARKP